MIAVRLGAWSTVCGIWFLWERIYWRHRWTPFVRIQWRYPKDRVFGFWRRR